MKTANLLIQDLKRDWNFYFESPLLEKNGLIELKQELITPEFLINWSFTTKLYGEQVILDHFVIGFPELTPLRKYAKSFLALGAKIIEGLGIFPIEFCDRATNVPQNLWLHLLTLLMPSGGLLVLAAPYASGDQLDRFQQERGLAAVHHVAISVNDVYHIAKDWQKKGFVPLSVIPLSYGSLTQWFLQNKAGQIIELINRHPGKKATFDCQNIAGLRLSEVTQ